MSNFNVKTWVVFGMWSAIWTAVYYAVLSVFVKKVNEDL